jgi:predicted membrane protein
MQGERQVSVTPQLALGVFIMAAGVLLTLDRLELVEIGGTLRLWPGFLIVVGVVMLANRTDAAGRFWGGAWIVVGGWLLLNTLGLVRVAIWELFWPAVLILIGMKLVTQTTRRRADAAAGVSASGSQIAILAESNRSSQNAPFRGTEMTAILGGCRLDLRQATIPPGEHAVIDVFALMGSVEIWVPGTWSVNTDVIPILGGVEDKRLLPSKGPETGAVAEPPPTLILRGQIVLAGLTLKN